MRPFCLKGFRSDDALLLLATSHQVRAIASHTLGVSPSVQSLHPLSLSYAGVRSAGSVLCASFPLRRCFLWRSSLIGARNRDCFFVQQQPDVAHPRLHVTSHPALFESAIRDAPLTSSAMSGAVDLRELNAKSAGFGAWVLEVHKMRLAEHEYTWQNQPRKGHAVECRRVAADGAYC